MVEIRDGERVTDEGGLAVTMLADLEAIGIADVRATPGGLAPPPHVHARHGEAVVLLEGELAFRLEDGKRRVEAESCVYVPPGVAHTFAASGDTPARFLDLHVPGAGFGAFVRKLHAARTEAELHAARAAFDQLPSASATRDPSLVVVRRTGGSEGEAIVDRPGRRATVLVEGDELTVSEFHYGGGERGAPLHVHREHADAFLVLEGAFAIGRRDGSWTAPAGTFVLIPPGVVHGFDNDGAEPARCLNLHLPSLGFADYLRGRNPAFDQHDPPPDGGLDPVAVVAVRLAPYEQAAS
ncbi:MAG TPA: cupin domain-containing protein [Gaiellaceae bacterium]|nr:cupin domain-containing protein [Gaiellaceae bacterium]